MNTWKRVLLIVLAAGAANVVLCAGGVATLTWWRMRRMPPPGPVVVAIQYDVVPDDPDASMDELIDQLDRRLNPRGQTPLAAVSLVGPDRLEIGLYENDARLFDWLDSKLTQTGGLEFQVLAHQRMHPREIALADGVGKDQSEVRDGNRLAARWVPIANPIAARSPTCVTRQIDEGNGSMRTDVLVIHDPEAPRGVHVARATATLDESDCRAMGIQFNDDGAHRMRAITSAHPGCARRPVPPRDPGPWYTTALR